ncbi:hypothetical protein BDZ97DRAFT_1158856 [Flammula alnicola]|nr:hypothetical protein BDZ97DRAFT_1158856 [Flammula alnicola]
MRFRICDSIAEFQQGVDLYHDITEEPWNVSLYSVIKVPAYDAFYQLLLEESVIDKDLISDIRSLPSIRGLSSSCLYHLNQPFILDLAHHEMHLSLMTRRSLETIKIIHSWMDTSPSRGILKMPYTGLIRARFELSTLPEHVELGPTLLLRILDVFKSVQCIIEGYDNYIAFPEAGTFLSRRSKKTGQYRPWRYPLNCRVAGKAFYTFMQNSQSAHGHNDMPRLTSSTGV